MGCWNGTCGLSKLPILYGEKIILIPIVKTGCEIIGGGFCEQDDIYKPLTVPLIGEYNEYGSIKNVENGQIVYDFFISNYKDEIKKIIEAENEKFPQIIEDIIYFIERGYFKNISFMMFHETVYYQVIEEHANRKPYDKDYTVKQHMKKVAIKYIEKAKKAIEENDVYKQIFGFDENSFYRFFQSKMRYFLHALIEQKDEKLLNKMIDLYSFSCAMSLARHAWMPQCGAGSQSQEYAIQKTIAEFIVEKVKKRLTDYREEDYCEGYSPIQETLFVYDREEEDD